MSTANAYLDVRGINVDVVYKDIKNVHIGIYPPVGRVRVAAPRQFDEERIRLAVIQRLPWIRRQRRALQAAVRQSPREMVSGESHYVWGVRRLLRVEERPGRPRLELRGAHLLLGVPEGMSTGARLKILRGWQREQLRAAIPPLIEKWQPRIGRPVAVWRIRRMKTKWGSCNRETASLLFNLELAKKPPHCLEYIVVHEMTHLLERNHNEHFTDLMDGFLPDWRTRRDELNGAPLAEERWLGGTRR